MGDMFCHVSTAHSKTGWLLAEKCTCIWYSTLIMPNLFHEKWKYIYILYNFTTLWWHRNFKSFLREDRNPLILHNPYHTCWWPQTHGIMVSTTRVVIKLPPQYTCLHNIGELNEVHWFDYIKGSPFSRPSIGHQGGSCDVPQTAEDTKDIAWLSFK